MLSLHLPQSSLVYVNTLMLQRVLTEPVWMAGMTTDDLRGLTPLIYTHVNPYERFPWTWLNASRSVQRRQRHECSRGS